MKKNILFIIPCSSYPLRSGGMHAIFNGIVAIREHFNIFVTYSAPNIPSEIDRKKRFEIELKDDRISVLPYFYNQEFSNVSFTRRCFNKVHHILNLIYPPAPPKGNPYSYWINELLPQPKGYIKHVLQIIEEKEIDIVQCEMLRTLSFIQQLPKHVKSIFVHHELGFVRHTLELPNREDDRFDGLSFLQCSKNLEISQLNQYNRIVTLSTIDSQKLHDAGVTAPISDSFAIIRQQQEVLHNNTDFNPLNLTFIGPDIHEPNELGIRWFLKYCWKDLLVLNPSYHLTVIGIWKEKNIKELTSKYSNLTFTGYVGDLASAILGSVMIIPITVGSGIRMKILEASSIGVPFVSTSIGAEGLPVENGKDCLIADNPKEFVSAICEMRNKDLVKRFVSRTKAIVNERYSVEALRKNRLSIYNSLYETE